jgi:hypothetical protein
MERLGCSATERPQGPLIWFHTANISEGHDGSIPSVCGLTLPRLQVKAQ